MNSQLKIGSNKILNWSFLVEPRFSIYLIAIVINIGSLQVVPGFTQLTFAKVLIIISTVLLVAKSLHFRQKIHIDLISALILSFALFAIPSLVSSKESNYILVVLGSFLGYLCLHTVVYNSIVSLSHFKSVLLCYIAGSTIQSLMIIANIYTNISFDQFNYRPSGSFENANAAAYVTSLGAIFGLTLIIIMKNMKNNWLLIGTGICISGLLLTLSRAGYSLFLVSIFILALYAPNKTRTLIISSIVLVTIVAILLSPDATLVIKRLVSLSNPLEDAALQYRLYSIMPAVELFQGNWLFGIGYMNYQFFIPRDVMEISSKTIHILLLGIATEMGVICLTIYLTIIYLTIKRLLSTIKNTKFSDVKFIYVMFLATLIGQVTFGLTHFSLLNASFWLTVALAAVACKMMPQYEKEIK